MNVAPQRTSSFSQRCAVLGVAALGLSWHVVSAQSTAPVVTGNARVDKLLGQLTLAEKLKLIHDAREDPRVGDEVPQAYLGAPSEPPAGVQFPLRRLVAFDRIHLTAGETKTVVLHVAPRELQYWSVATGTWVTANGQRTVSVGASSRDFRLEQRID
jgi:hypothetical protein